MPHPVRQGDSVLGTAWQEMGWISSRRSFNIWPSRVWRMPGVGSSSVTDSRPGSWWVALQRVPDRRDRAGCQYPLARLLAIAVVDLLSGRQGQDRLKAMGRETVRRCPDALVPLGIIRGLFGLVRILQEARCGGSGTGSGRLGCGWATGRSHGTGRQMDP